MFTLRIRPSSEFTNEEFLNAVDCARICIESVLYDFGSTVATENDRILIKANGITKDEIMQKIKGCFCNNIGIIYAEFLHVELLSQNV